MSTSPICDIVIPIYNALTQTSRCIQSVLSQSSRPFRLVLVNDASDEMTTKIVRELRESANKIAWCTESVLLENENNQGFLHTANRGLEFEDFVTSKDPSLFKVILNSDTVVTAGWLERFERCFESDGTIGLATPLSNNAENLSVAIPPGRSWLDVAGAIAETDISEGYPDVATAIGFCMAIRCTALKMVGAFDEIFAPGYAEDSDLHYRFLSKGFRSVAVPNSFIFHESHASFSSNKERLVRRNRPVFDQRWSTIYANDLAHHNSIRPLENAEAQIAKLRKESPEHDVLFVIPTSKLFGGIIVVYEVINRLLALGMNANAVVLTDEAPIDMQLLFTPYFRSPSSWFGPLPKSKLFVATHFETCPYVHEAVAKTPGSKPVYLVQGYEAWFPGASIEEVVHTYRSIPIRTCVSKWVAQMLERWDCASETIPNGVDTTFFYPAKPSDLGTARPKGDAITIITLLREDPQGGWRLASSVLSRLKSLRPEIKIIGVGNLVNHPELAPLLSEKHQHADRKAMRILYHKADVFLDCSMVQGFGLMGLEAMASGLAVVTGSTGGVTEYASSENSIMVELGDENGFVDALLSLQNDQNLLSILKLRGFQTAQDFAWDKAAQSYETFFKRAIAEGPELSTENLQANSHYLFGRLVRNEDVSSKTFIAQTHLAKELRSTLRPAGAYDVMLRDGKADLLPTLQTTHAGIALTRVYEEARHSVERIFSLSEMETVRTFAAKASDTPLAHVAAMVLPPK